MNTLLSSLCQLLMLHCDDVSVIYGDLLMGQVCLQGYHPVFVDLVAVNN